MFKGTLFILAVIAAIATAVYMVIRALKNAPIITSKGSYAASDKAEIIRLRQGILDVLKTTRPGTDVEITVEASGVVRERMTFKLEAIEPG